MNIQTAGGTYTSFSHLSLRGKLFLIHGRVFSKPTDKDILTDYISFPLGIKKWRRALK